jgi:hypothetical protein
VRLLFSSRAFWRSFLLRYLADSECRVHALLNVGEVSENEGNYIPIVAMELNRPLAIRSISASICCSVEDGELRMVYVECGIGVVVCPVDDVVINSDGGAGKRENSEGEGAINERYWSRTYAGDINRDREWCQIRRACSTESPVPSRATAAASSSRSARGKGSTKFR